MVFGGQKWVAARCVVRLIFERGMWFRFSEPPYCFGTGGRGLFGGGPGDGGRLIMTGTIVSE